MEGDFIFVNPVMPSDFVASGGKPIITTTMQDKTVHVLDPDLNEDKEVKSYIKNLIPSYQTFIPGSDMPPSHVPFRINHVIHRPLPMLASFNQALEKVYAEWFAFVRSHKTSVISPYGYPPAGCPRGPLGGPRVPLGGP